MTATALVVDDEVDLCRLMQITLTKMGIKSDVAYDLAQAKAYWQANEYDFCLTDLQLPDGSGLELVKLISSSSCVPVAVITAHGSMDLAIEALKLGAFDFVNKPLELPRLRQVVENALKVIRQDDAQTVDTQTPEQQLLDQRLIGDTQVMHTLKSTILKLARSQAPVFLSGASGTGKEVAARLIHDLSPRREAHFVPVNCGAIPSELMESEFFGHKKGSFTGAVADKQGLFQQANGGTLFLDEIADLPLAMQVKLLRAIQEKTVRAIGDTKEVAVDIRLLSATHKDLAQLVAANNFRQDLYYRINVIELKLPALNERAHDIPALAQHFLALIREEWQLEGSPQLSDDAIQRLKAHHFAGNVRELRNLLERAITLAESDIIAVEHLGLPDPDGSSSEQSPFHQSQPMTKQTTQTTLSDSSAPIINSLSADTPQAEEPVKKAVANKPSRPYRVQSPLFAPDSIQPFSTDSLTEHKTVKPSSESQTNQLNNMQKDTTASVSVATQKSTPAELPEKGLEAYLQQQEKQLIITALQQTGWNKTQAAELLGTTFRSLRYRMKKLEIAEEQTD
ncbi:sigma-54-dependent transcriptional regulator [Psychrobacter sp. 2Y5]|uniref:sigma-54-dependent transcriptional regulator n=1 Tax=unclassified Psychrobacter TaxID=196806 RepID=UPI003F461B0D